MFNTLFNTLLESSPYIILGFIIAGILKFYVPQNVLQKHVGTKSPLALLKSVTIGSILPLCSCGTVPLGIGLYRSGGAIGNIFAFMISTPILSPVLIALALSFLGVKLTVTFIIVAVVGSYTIGFIANRVFKNSYETDNGEFCKKEYQSIITSKKQSKNKLSQTLKWSFFELGSDVSVDIAIGLSIAALLLTLLPMELISTFLGQQNIYTLLYVILLGIPVYACSIPSIPVVQGLLMLGATPGAAVAYLIAGPATNLGELNAIRRSMGSKQAIFYAVAIFIMALTAGLITDNLVFPNYQYHAYKVQGELVVQQCCVPLIFGEGINATLKPEIPIWHWPFGIALFGIIGFGLITKIRHFFVNPCKSCNWKAYNIDGFCGSKCHVRRNFEFLRRVNNNKS